VPRRPQLVHYTDRVGNVGSILGNGFLLIPNSRNLIHKLLDEDDPWDREPQEWGMVCFSEVPVGAAEDHRSIFGRFGVAVSWSWAASNGIDRVIYVREDGPVFALWRFLFQSAYQDLKTRESSGSPSWGGMSAYNRAMASSIGAAGWATLLRLYEFMQPQADSDQAEWRIVNRQPFHFASRDKNQQIKQALEMSKTWQLANLRLHPRDVELLVCPKASVAELRAVLPEDFRHTSIHVY
jgi:hypothetical protein